MAPFKQKFVLPDGREITSVVIDQIEFDAFCDQLTGIFTQTGDRANATAIERIREAKHLPIMAIGTRTMKFFTQWDIDTTLLCVIVRGFGPKLAEKLINGH